MAKASMITITDKVKQLYPELAKSRQVFKNWVLEKARADHAELMGRVIGGRVIDFAPEHYKPLGLQVIIYRHNGCSVWVGCCDEGFEDNAELL